MKNRVRPSLNSIVKTLCLSSALLGLNAYSAVTYWDPQGTTGSNPYSNSMTGTWEAAAWSTSSSGSATPVAWIESTAACFGVHTGIGTPAFTVTMNANHTLAGFFDGPLTPNSCDVTITGPGIITLASGADAFDVLNASDGSLGLLRINNNLTGSGTLTAEGGGQIFLNGTNSFTGGTLLGFSGNSFGGIINFANGTAFGTGAITLSNTAVNCALVVQGTNAVTITNAVKYLTAKGINVVGNPAGVTFSGPWTLSTNGNIGSGVAGNLVIISGVVSGTGSFNKFNPATLKVSGANTYTGGTTISNGVMQLGNNSGVPGGTGKGNVYIDLLGTLDVNGFSSTINGLTGNGYIDNTSTNTGTLNVGNNNQDGSFDGLIENTVAPLNLTKSGTGTFTVSGLNSYSGVTTVNGGVMQLNGGVIPSGSPLIVNALGTLNMNFSGQTVPYLSGSGVISNSGSFTLSGDSTTNSFNSYSCVLNSFDGGTLTKNGNHVMALRQTNLYNVGFTFNSGTLSVGAGPDRLPPTTSLSVPTGSLFELDANSQTLASLSGSGNVNLGGGTLTVNESGNQTFSGIIQESELPGSSTALGHGLRGYYYDNADFSNLIAVRDDANVNFTNFNVAGLPAAFGANTNYFSIRWQGQVLTTVAGTYTFTTTSDDGQRLWVNGTLLVDNWATQGATAKSGSITLAANTRYDIVMEYFNGTGGTSTKLAWTPPGDLVSTVIPTDNLFLPGAGKFVFGGTGTLALASTNTYSGGTIINSGTIQAQADGALGSGNVYVNTNGTLSLGGGLTNGYINPQADLVMNGATAAVALNYTGNMTVHGLSLDGGATYQPVGTYGRIGSGAAHEKAQFTGDGLLTVTASPATVVLTSSGNTSAYGNPVTLTATVSGAAGTPTGAVTFYDASSAIGVGVLDGTGTATLSVSDFSVITSPHTVTAVYGGNATYLQASSAALTQTVTPLTISPGTIVVSNKVYDSTLNGIVATNTASTLVGALASDTNFVHIGSGTATFSDANIGTNKTVSVSNLTLGGDLAGNYVLSPTTATSSANISSATLTVTGITAASRVYNANTNATLDVSSAVLVGVFAGDDVTLNTSGVIGYFANATVANNKTVTITGLTVTGGSIGNYVLTQPTTTASITKASTLNLIVSSANPSAPGASVNFTVTASPVAPGAGTPTGNIIFQTNGVAFSTNALASGSATSLSTTNLPLGTNVITANYAGDGSFVGNTNTYNQVVQVPIVNPTLLITNAAGNATISWSGNFTLQSTTNISSGWQDVVPTATSPYTPGLTNAQQFFRLRN